MTSWKNNNTLESRRLVEEVLDPEKKSKKVTARDKNHLHRIISRRIEKYGPNCDLNDIDVSKWNVSNVKDMTEMFRLSPLEGKEPGWYKV